MARRPSAPARRIVVSRTLTDTPLARRHERFVAQGEPRKPKPIPWEKFERDRYPEPALRLAADAMLALAAGEYDAVLGFARLAAALVASGAPFDLVSAAASVPADEIRHSDCALRMAKLCAGRGIAAGFERVAVEPAWLPGAAGALDISMVELPVISETLAAAMLTACRDRATDLVARALFASLVADEVHHLRLGWYYLAWRSPQWTRAERQRVADRAGEILVGLERQFWRGRDAPRNSRRAARALGVLDSPALRAVVRRTVEREIVPGLDALGLGASRAWRVRLRGA